MIELSQAQRDEIYDKTIKIDSALDGRIEAERLFNSEFRNTEINEPSKTQMNNELKYNLGEYTVMLPTTASQVPTDHQYPEGTYRQNKSQKYPDHIVTESALKSQSPFREKSNEIDEDQKVEINICTNCNFYQTQKTKIAVISLITVLLSITLIILKKVLGD